MKTRPNNRRTILHAGLAAGAATGLSALMPLKGALAQAWPTKPVKFILSQPAGAGPDVMARFVGEHLARAIGQPVVIENRPGGQNVIGAQAAAKSAPDGYSYYYGTTAAIVTNVYTFKNLPYDPRKDFMPVSLIGKSPFLIAASPSANVKTLGEALALARAQPEKVSIGTEGPKTFSGMLADMVASLANVRLTHVPYQKSPEAIQDAIGGRIQLLCLPSAALIPQIRANRLVPLAISSLQRLPGLPDTPPIADTFAGFEYTGWHGLFAPAGTPAEVVSRINRELDRILRTPEVAERMLAMGSHAEGSGSPQSFGGFVNAEFGRWEKIVKSLNIQAE
ncbi:MAG: Bug family tripartite tricarboxylate transporter substrate binding protein [Burkholderiales bacterium]